MNTSTDGFSEGAGLTASTGDGDSQSNTLSTLGLRLEKTFAVGEGLLRANATLGWQHAFGEVDRL